MLVEKEQKVQQTLERFNREVYDKGKLEAIDELVTEDFRHHAPFPTPQGREGFKKVPVRLSQGFPRRRVHHRGRQLSRSPHPGRQRR